MKKCVNCGYEFNGKSKFCSYDCKSDVYGRTGKKWFSNEAPDSQRTYGMRLRDGFAANSDDGGEASFY